MKQLEGTSFSEQNGALSLSIDFDEINLLKHYSIQEIMWQWHLACKLVCCYSTGSHYSLLKRIDLQLFLPQFYLFCVSWNTKPKYFFFVSAFTFDKIC